MRQRDIGGRAPRAIAFLVLSALFFPAPAGAGLPKRQFGPGIDPFATYDGQSTCDPDPEPGVLSFKRLVTRAFPRTDEGYISRSCWVGGQSEHKEGRAWDWPMNAYKDSDRKKVNALLDWLLKRDAYGHKNARVRRFGIMYIIWDRRIWFPWNGWGAYRGSSPHTDHVHFSFTWPGAKRRTTNWHRPRSFVTATASNPREQGHWSATGTATVLAAGGDFHGDRRSRWARGIVRGIAPTAQADGYWLAKQSGKIFAYGDARKLGMYKGPGRVVDIASTPRGQGFWTVTSRGRVRAFGNAEDHGDSTSRARIVGLAPTPSGSGYWLVSKKGRIFSFGNARDLGGITNGTMRIIDIEPAPTQGYWLVSRNGRVTSFGGASFRGDVRDLTIRSPIAGLASTPSGNGYWLINARGKARRFGTAEALRSTSATSPRPTPPDEGEPIPERRER